MGNRLLCEDCDWTGLESDCEIWVFPLDDEGWLNYSGGAYLWGREEINCPKCGSVNLIELSDDKERILQPA